MGLPGSGKSSFAKSLMAKNSTYKRINKDQMRLLFDFGVWNKKNEQFINNMEEILMREILSAGYNLIIDNTNMELKWLQRAERIAEEYDCDLEIKEFNTPLDICLDRDSKRENPVGSKVIQGMANRYLKRPQEVKFIEGLQDAAIIDIDGVLAFKGDRDIFDYTKVHLDTVNPLIQRFINLLPSSIKIIFCSGRDDVCYSETMNWIKTKVNFPNNNDCVLFMRETLDRRADDIVKSEIYDKYIKGKYNISFLCDDRLRVKQMWFDRGLPLFGIGNPSLDF